MTVDDISHHELIGGYLCAVNRLFVHPCTGLIQYWMVLKFSVHRRPNCTLPKLSRLGRRQEFKVLTSPRNLYSRIRGDLDSDPMDNSVEHHAYHLVV